MTARTASKSSAIRPARKAATLWLWFHAGEPEYELEGPCEPGPNECVAISRPPPARHLAEVR